MPLAGDLAHNPGKCLDGECGSQASTQSTEPHQPGPQGPLWCSPALPLISPLVYSPLFYYMGPSSTSQPQDICTCHSFAWNALPNMSTWFSPLFPSCVLNVTFLVRLSQMYPSFTSPLLSLSLCLSSYGIPYDRVIYLIIMFPPLGRKLHVGKYFLCVLFPAASLEPKTAFCL
ncbi:hypothetical protein HJG60_009554 [Phyllostomus discolor]|uniref:Uncharacterized protein n=1 Tax=Phyllostomus discolor TaxID=89673 RepID=A0A833YHM7_9CHIR|nr:hypothetical protein HJG60_009554 [Phyllostomus discolor]